MEKYSRFLKERNGTNTHVRHMIEYKLPTTGKIADFLSGDKQKIKYNKVCNKLLKQ